MAMHRLVLVVGVLAVTLGGLVIGIGSPTVVTAAGTPVIANGNNACGVAGTITYSPPLVNGGTSVATLTFKPTSCLNSSTNVSHKLALPKAKATGTGGATSTSPFSSGLLIKWVSATESPQITSTTIAVTSFDAHFSVDSSQNAEIVLAGQAGGSFAVNPTSASVTLDTTTPTDTLASELSGSGVSSLTFTSGHLEV